MHNIIYLFIYVIYEIRCVSINEYYEDPNDVLIMTFPFYLKLECLNLRCQMLKYPLNDPFRHVAINQ